MRRITILINSFFIYAILGWALEVAYNGIREGKYINCGVLNGPWCPIYGFGAIAIFSLLDTLKTDSKLLLFFGSMVIASVLELITGFILEKVFHKKWWDYSDKKFNIGGYICAEYSLLWGALCFIIYEAVHPLVMGLIEFSPHRLVDFVNMFLATLLIVDTIATINTILGINKKFKQIEKSSERIGELTDELGEKIAYRGIDGAIKANDRKKHFDERSED